MSEETKPDTPENLNEDQSAEDPFDIKKSSGAILTLIGVCALLWLLSKFGPSGADWISDRTEALVMGEKKEVPGPDEVDSPRILSPDPKSTPVQPVIQEADDKSSKAKDLIIDKLGGPQKVSIANLAFSKDGSSMVAEVKFLDSGKVEDLYLRLDEYERFVSDPESPIDEPIKIWKQELEK